MTKQTVITGIAPLYLKPEEGAELTDEALLGMTVEITGEKVGRFFPVRTHYRYEGFMPDECLTSNGECGFFASKPKWIVWAPYLDIQTAPKVQASIIIGCPRGSVLADLGDENKDETPEGWKYVGLPCGNKGYTRAVSLKPHPGVKKIFGESFAGSDIGVFHRTDIDGSRHPALFGKDHEMGLRRSLVSTAMLYMRTQYRWGGKTPLGIDCSGLTAMAYMLNGIIIYRDAEIRLGFAIKEVNFNKMDIGDLIFWKGHVAMYIGNGEYVHSTGHGKSAGVVINSLEPDSSIYREDLAKSITHIGSVFI